jgi:hypothetical protein
MKVNVKTLVALVFVSALSGAAGGAYSFHILSRKPDVDSISVKTITAEEVFAKKVSVSAGLNGSVVIGPHDEAPSIIVSSIGSQKSVISPGNILINGENSGQEIKLESNNDSTFIALSHKPEYYSMSLEASTSGTRIYLMDRAGKIRACLGSVELKDPKTERVTNEPESTLSLFNKQGNLIFKIPFNYR